MMKIPSILMALPLLLALLTACGDPKPVTDALHRAETLMNEYPDSALAVLNTLSPDAMGIGHRLRVVAGRQQGQQQE